MHHKSRVDLLKQCVFCFRVIPQVLLGITLSWLICYILTIYNVLPSDPVQYGYLARTDVKGDVIGRAPWFRFPYPGIAVLKGPFTQKLMSFFNHPCHSRLSSTEQKDDFEKRW